MAALKSLQLVKKSPITTAMRLGLELEEAVLKEYVDLNPGIKITREGVSVHGDPAFSWAIFSPDAFGHRLLKDTYRILHYKSVMTM